MALTSSMRQLEISYREDEIDLEETRGRGAFRMDLEFTYGREARDPAFDRVWAEPSNTYTVDAANTFLDAFLGWRQSLQRLQDLTYYDFEADLPVLDRFDIDVEAAMENGGTTATR